MNIININKISLSEQTQCRASLNQEALNEYCERFRAGEVPPPIHLIFDSASYYITDGHHRFHAARQAGVEELPCVVSEGTLRDATLAAVQANADNGVNRSNADKRKAVMMLLEDEEWGKWSNREIARRCRVGATLVNSLRDHTALRGQYEPGTPTFIHPKTGEPTTMNTTNIGKKSSSSSPKNPDAIPEHMRENDEAYRKINGDLRRLTERLERYEGYLSPVQHDDILKVFRLLTAIVKQRLAKYPGR